MTAPTIMLLGDSLTAPYVPTFAKLLDGAKVAYRLIGTQGKPPLSHEGHGGYRIQRLADGLLEPATGYFAKAGVPAYAVICAGTNDLVSMPFPDVPKLLTQWAALVGAFKSRGARVVVCTTPQTTIPNSPGVNAFNRGVRAYVASNGARTKLADLERGIPTSELSADGVHLSPAGAAHMGTIIARAMSTKVGAQVSPIAEVKRRRVAAIGFVVLAAGALMLAR